ncbi:hypothetical protein ACFL6U_15730 [Planctomycetota bacterium]
MYSADGQHCSKIRSTAVILIVLIATTTISKGQQNNRTISEKPAEPALTIKHMQPDKKALGQMIQQLNMLRPRDVTFDATAVSRIYSEPVQWQKIDDRKVDLHLELASALERSATLAHRPELLKISALAYQRIIYSTQGETRLRASCNYSAQLLRANQPQEAIKVMEAAAPILRSDSLGAIARSRSLYTYGTALQRSGDAQRAYEILNKAVKADPTFRKAAQAAGEAAMDADHESTGIPLAVEQIAGRLANFDYNGAAHILRNAMEVDHWLHHDFYPQILGQFVRYLTASRMAPEAIRKEWWTYLENLRNRLPKYDAPHQMITQIMNIYSEPLRIMNIDPIQIKQHYDAWGAAARGAGSTPNLDFLSDFIKMVGDHYYRQGDPQSLRLSMQRYCHAWGVNTKNMEAALYLANVLHYDQQHLKQQLDPNGLILDMFINRLFQVKNLQYRLDVGKDWERILKCHIVLATIFENQKRWGPQENPRTAWFQWQLASNALQNVTNSTIHDQFGLVVSKGLARAQENY